MIFRQTAGIAGSVALLGSCWTLNTSFNSNFARLEEEDDEARLPPPEPKLCQVQVIFRHGARTPVFGSKGLQNLPLNLCSGVNKPPGTAFDSPPQLSDVHFAQLHVTDLTGENPRPFSSIDHFQASHVMKGGECRLGQLTEVGAKQSSDLGKRLRERYKDRIPISAETVTARSTNVGRCMATLSALLGSLLDIGNKRSNMRNHPVIEVRTTSSREEYMTPNHSFCEILRTYFRSGREELAKGYENGTEILGLGIKKELKNILPSNLYKGLKVNENNFIRVHDWASILETHYESLDKEELKKTSFNKIVNNAKLMSGLRQQAAIEVATLIGAEVSKEGKQVELTAESKEKLKYAIGLFLKELHDNVMGYKKPSFHLYSGHDTTIVPLLLAMGIYDVEWPYYCSNVAIELWDLSGGENGEDTSESDSDGVSDLESTIENSINLEKYQVRILYNAKEMKRMSLSEFRDYCKDLIPESYDEFKQGCSNFSGKDPKQHSTRAAGGSVFK